MQDALVNSIFQPDSVAAAQFDETMQRSIPLEPEKKLMLAVLEDAVMCFQDNFLTRDKKKKQLFDETELWIFEERSDRLFAFANVCQELNLDPHYVRSGLRQWQENRLRLCTHGASGRPTLAKTISAPRPQRHSRTGRPTRKKYRHTPHPGRNRAPMTASRFRA